MKTIIVISGKHIALNEYTKSNRTNQYVGAREKESAQELVAWVIKAARPPFISGEVTITFDWYEPDKRHDPDNIAFFKKVILDALVTQHVIGGDGWKYLSMPEPFRDRFFVDKKNPRIEVTIEGGGTDAGK